MHAPLHLVISYSAVNASQVVATEGASHSYV